MILILRCFVVWAPGNVSEVLIFTKFARRTNPRNQESREKYYYTSATNEKCECANSNFREKVSK